MGIIGLKKLLEKLALAKFISLLPYPNPSQPTLTPGTPPTTNTTNTTTPVTTTGVGGNTSTTTPTGGNTSTATPVTTATGGAEKRTLVIDGSCLSSVLHNTSVNSVPGGPATAGVGSTAPKPVGPIKPIPMFYGAQWLDFYTNVQTLVNKLRVDCNFNVVVIFDGIDEDIKQSTMKGRHLATRDKTILAFEKIRDGYKPLTYDSPAGGWRNILQIMLRSLNVEVVQAPFEADSFIIAYCKDHKVWGILANDYDFCVLPYVNKFLDINSWNIETSEINCVDRTEQLSTFGISQELLQIYGCIVSKDFSSDEDREKMAPHIKKQVSSRKFVIFDSDGRRDRGQEDIIWNETVLEWIRTKISRGSSPADLLSELKSVFPQVSEVHEKFTDFRVPTQAEVGNFIIDRFSQAGFYIPPKIISEFLDGSGTTVGDISYFINNVSVGRGLEHTEIFGMTAHDMMSIGNRIQMGILFPTPKLVIQNNLSFGEKSIIEAENIVNSLTQFLSSSNLTTPSRPTWSSVSQSMTQLLQQSQQLLNDFKNPFFVYWVYEHGTPKKVFPVRIVADINNNNNDIIHWEYLLNDNIPREKRVTWFILTSLIASPKYITSDTKTATTTAPTTATTTTNTPIINNNNYNNNNIDNNNTDNNTAMEIDTTAKFGPEFNGIISKIPLLSSDLDNVLFVATVVYMINNGLNNKLYQRELDGMILQYLMIKNHTNNNINWKSFYDPPVTVRSITLFTFFTNAFNLHRSFFRYFRLNNNSNNTWKYLHGQVFNYFVAYSRPSYLINNNTNEQLLKQFTELKQIIIDFVGDFVPAQEENVASVPVEMKSEEKPKCTFYFQRGLCKYGDACKFSHEGELSPEVLAMRENVVPSATNFAPANYASFNTSYYNDNSNNNNYQNTATTTAMTTGITTGITSPPNYGRGKPPCKYFMEGRCFKGDDCFFAHVASPSNSHTQYNQSNVNAGFGAKRPWNNDNNNKQ